MYNFEANYGKILEVLRENIQKESFIHQKRKPKLSDLELIGVNLTAEYMGIDSECQLFRVLKNTELYSVISRTVYNRRKRRLIGAIEEVREVFSNKFNEFEQYYIVDSMPLEACKLSRGGRSRICKEEIFSSPNFGYCASQKMSFYGYKIHAVCSVQGVFKSYDISKASVHDIHYLNDLKYELSDCVLIGDKGYLGKQQQLNLFETANVKLEVPMRKNQKGYKKQPYIFRKSRKRIETLFSQLCDQFMIRSNYAKSFLGFKTRVASKITALTIIQFINKFTFDRNINNLKVNII